MNLLIKPPFWQLDLIGLYEFTILVDKIYTSE